MCGKGGSDMTKNKKEGTRRRTISELLFGKRPVPARKPKQSTQTFAAKRRAAEEAKRKNELR